MTPLFTLHVGGYLLGAKLGITSSSVQLRMDKSIVGRLFCGSRDSLPTKGPYVGGSVWGLGHFGSLGTTYLGVSEKHPKGPKVPRAVMGLP
jgi:hypothetical protein